MVEQKPDKDVMDEFRRRRIRGWLMVIPAIASASCLIAGTEVAGGLGALLLVVGILLFGGTMTLSIWNWRCPACDRYLGRGRFPKYCPRCGVQLVEEGED